MTKRSIYIRIGVVLVACIVSVGVTLLKVGAIHGTYIASLGARAAILAEQPSMRTASAFPDLQPNAPGGQVAQVFDASGQPSWTSPSATGMTLPIGPTDQLFSAALKTGSYLGMTVHTHGLTATYMAPSGPYLHDELRVIGLPLFTVVIPTLLFVLIYPGKRPPAPPTLSTPSPG